MARFFLTERTLKWAFAELFVTDELDLDMELNKRVHVVMVYRNVQILAAILSMRSITGSRRSRFILMKHVW